MRERLYVLMAICQKLRTYDIKKLNELDDDELVSILKSLEKLSFDYNKNVFHETENK